MIQQAVILCGGKGTRLGEVALSTPKALIPLGGRPLLEWTLDLLQKHGITKVILAAGHLGEVLAGHIVSHPRPGMQVHVFIERQPLGTAGCLPEFADLLEDEFLLVYGDIFLDLNLSALMAAHEEKKPLATLLVRASDHPWDSHLVDADENGLVKEFIHHQEPGRLYRNMANAALYVLSRSLLEFLEKGVAADFGKDVFPKVLAGGGKMVVHRLEPGAFVKDMGTPERLARVERYLQRKARADTARRNPKMVRHVLFDRDGTLNQDRGLITRPEDLDLLPGAAEAVARLNQEGIDCVVVTNQPVIARGLCDVETLEEIHQKLRQEVGRAGGSLRAIYFSPFHPETHHGEGVKELRRASDCRKPEPGMIFQATEEQGWDLSECVMVGDTENDRWAAWNAGIRFIGIGTRPEWVEAGVPMVDGPSEAVDWILANMRGA